MVLKYMNESSLFVLHRDSCLRKFFIRLTLQKLKKPKTHLENFLSVIQNGGQEDDSEDFDQWGSDKGSSEAQHACTNDG